MRKSLLFLLLGLCQNICAGNLSEGRTLFYDRLTDTYLCSVEESNFTGETLAEKSADGKDINFTFLPVARLSSAEFSREYTPVTFTLAMPDGSVDTEMPAKAKWRGATTAAEGKHKKSFHIKFLDSEGNKQDRKFFGFRNDDSWLLDACQVDMSRIRNRVAMELWNDFATKPYYADKEKKMRTYTRGQFIELFIDDEYRGIFCMSEAIDRSQVKVMKTDENGNHGMLWKSGGFTYTRFADYADYDNTSNEWGSWEVKYPEAGDDCEQTDWSVLYSAIKFVADLDFNDYDGFLRKADEYFDMPVYKDYFLFAQVLHAVDNMNGKNIYWACYDQQSDRRLTLIPWDLDCTVGQCPDNISHFHEPETRPDRYYNLAMSEKIGYFLYEVYRDEQDNVHPYNWDSLNEMYTRYMELRKDVFREDSLVARYDHYFDMLDKCGAYSRETARWSGDSDIDGQPLDFAKEREYIHQWIHDRLVSLDQQFADPLQAYDVYTGIQGTVQKNNTHTTIYNINGMRMNNSSTANLPSGIYIMDGKKIVVK